jgi:MFS family permease
VPLIIVFFTVFIDLLGFGIIIPLLPFYAETFGATAFTVGLLATSFSLMQFVFAPIWGRVSDRVGRRPIILLGCSVRANPPSASDGATLTALSPRIFAACRPDIPPPRPSWPT